MSLLDDENILIEQTKCSIWDVIYNAVINESVTQELLDYLNENLKISGSGSWNTTYNQKNICFDDESCVVSAINFMRSKTNIFFVEISNGNLLEKFYEITIDSRLEIIKEIKDSLDLEINGPICTDRRTILYKNLK